MPRTFTGQNLLQIAMPIGGIGAGCVCLSGYGALQDFSIRNKPAVTAVPGNWPNDAAFALLHIKGEKPTTKLVQGPLPRGKIYDQGLQGEGYRKGGYEGFPRFNDCTFAAEYPFGHVTLSDARLPLKVNLTGFNPFIPLDDKNSSIPCCILEYTIENSSEKPVDFEFSYHLSHLAVGSKREPGTRSKTVPGGAYLFNTEDPLHETFGSASLTVIGHSPRVKAEWPRGGWFDSMSALWKEISTDSFAENTGTTKDEGGLNGCSILLPATLAPGDKITFPILITWHFTNCYDAIGLVQLGSKQAPTWHPWYITQWANAAEVAEYVQKNNTTLKQRALAFKDALFSSTIPAEALDAISSNLAILKSPTVLRQENGNLWGWEGCFPQGGCCHGSCTHVWNYAQSIPHLFPQLERTLREQEYKYSMDDRGHVTFRSALPNAPTKHDFHAASDGQLGGIMKTYRDWQIAGDRAWLEKLYPSLKKSLDFCIHQWDPDKKGALFAPHHNTYDIEFHGPEPMCTSVYIGALAAMSHMARELGYDDDARDYLALAKRGAQFMDDQLFNGEYFQQQELPDAPKYQYGRGCLSDGVIGAWMSTIYGIDSPINQNNVRNHLAATYNHNFKIDLFDHANPQRPGYALGHEPGLLLCSWPRGNKPTLPFVYSDEVWTGIEYQVASHCIAEGLVKEGLSIVAGARSRYDGYTRNPFNEYECGNYYARAMSSYALLGALSGFRYSAVTKTLWLNPKLPARPFKTFFSTATGFGTITLDNKSLTIEIAEGELPVNKVILPDAERAWNATARKAASATMAL